jgi:hypothetical protein
MILPLVNLRQEEIGSHAAHLLLSALENAALDGVTGRLPGAVKVVIPQHSDVADRVGPNVQPSTIEG